MSKPEWNNLSEEAKQVAIGMITYCLNNHIGLGMDGGYDLVDDDENGTAKPFRVELELFVGDEWLR